MKKAAAKKKPKKKVTLRDEEKAWEKAFAPTATTSTFTMSVGGRSKEDLQKQIQALNDERVTCTKTERHQHEKINCIECTHRSFIAGYLQALCVTVEGEPHWSKVTNYVALVEKGDGPDDVPLDGLLLQRVLRALEQDPDGHDPYVPQDVTQPPIEEETP